jgi:hypothetical protein
MPAVLRDEALPVYLVPDASAPPEGRRCDRYCAACSMVAERAARDRGSDPDLQRISSSRIASVNFSLMQAGSPRGGWMPFVAVDRASCNIVFFLFCCSVRVGRRELLLLPFPAGRLIQSSPFLLREAATTKR